jgi:threonine synthase
MGALLGGLAPDGGLYVPTTIPTLPDEWSSWSYVDAVSSSLHLFGAENVGELVEEATSRFDQPETAPIVQVGDRLVLELFWGPTLSFKDHALQVLARLLTRASHGATVLGATSGDTGAAAIEACAGLMPIVILFPEGRISEIPRRQMTTVDSPGVTVLAVRGTFDDCQGLVKGAFGMVPGLLAVNSINWARVAAQVGYYLYAAAQIGEPFDIVVPTGNFGNAYSCWMAKQMGAPIGDIVLANNANHSLADFIATGLTASAEVTPTLAPAMDIQVPSNLERLRVDLSTEVSAGWVDDDGIIETIGRVRTDHGYLLDPHTATAWRVGDDHPGRRPLLVVATAHPAKFPDVIRTATGVEPPLHPRLEAALNAEERCTFIDANLADLIEYVQ